MPRLDYSENGLPLKEWTPPEEPRRQRLPKLTPDEQAFCHGMVEVHFESATSAVRHIWPESPDPKQRAKKLMRKRHVRYAIEVLRNRAFDQHVLGRLGAVQETYEALRQLTSDLATPPYVRVKAAGQMLRVLGDVRGDRLRCSP
jgi:hypothetical protein